MEKTNLFRWIIKGGGALLIIFFFTLPLVQCTAQGMGGLNASGWEIATGTGDLFSETDEGANPVVFLSLIIPIVLLILAVAKKSFKMLGIVALAGFVFKIIFMIAANVRVAEAEGLFALTGLNWLILLLYAGLGALSFYSAKQS